MFAIKRGIDLYFFFRKAEGREQKKERYNIVRIVYLIYLGVIKVVSYSVLGGGGG